MTTVIAIKAQKLTKVYKNKRAVDEVDLSIKQGEIFCLLGVNGAGKTTILKMLSCLTRPTSGDGFLLGNSIISNPQKVREQINVSPQETAVALNLNVRENVELISRIYGNGKDESKEKASELLAEFGMDEIEKEKAKNLSGGWQRRLSIAMALSSNPKILFLDEPTLGLDVLARRQLWGMIQKLKGKMTIILTTHYLEEAEVLADHIGILEKGRLKALGTVPELLKMTGAKNLEEAFVSLCEEGGDLR